MLLVVCDLREKKAEVERIDRLQADTMMWFSVVQCGTVLCSGVVTL